ncbi:hypothetical protein Q5H93_21570 [Hymenobacter sp. ASUV-10]|uniref:DNA-binding protein n=1 Tax=Hymenobacter aranciens TaxID=3063996 RepID=A0ABT9BGG4_9BACT|nr:hypothetical protein [Hymenobacter sp. ASUV-10]MDO7877349.1 hypothetical protein [Hymenobacter sp. ASUV-10]
MQLDIKNGVAELRLSKPSEQEFLNVVGRQYADSRAAAEVANRTYHMGGTPTPERGYDDRLTTRLGQCATTCYKYLGLFPAPGGLRHARLGKKYHVTEQDVRDFEAFQSGRQAA